MHFSCCANHASLQKQNQNQKQNQKQFGLGETLGASSLSLSLHRAAKDREQVN